MEQNDIGFITVAICGGYISKYPSLLIRFLDKLSGIANMMASSL